jgi:hypothetical protein
MKRLAAIREQTTPQHSRTSTVRRRNNGFPGPEAVMVLANPGKPRGPRRARRAVGSADAKLPAVPRS